jgi:hypothetical protein
MSTPESKVYLTYVTMSIEQPYAKVDLNPIPDFIPPNQGHRIWPLGVFASRRGGGGGEGADSFDTKKSVFFFTYYCSMAETKVSIF